jgi:hypothetical protein
MTTQEYLESILKEQALSSDSQEIKDVMKERERVEAILTKEFKDSKPTIRYAGSKAKNTMIRDSYDLDIACYFAHDDSDPGSSLRDIYDNVKKTLQTGYIVEPKSSALRLKSSDSKNVRVDFHIDIVPGRYINNESTDVYLHISSGEKKYLKTNLHKQVDHIKDSGKTDIIKLIKYWKVRWGIQIRTFVLELLVVEVLKKSDPAKFESCLMKFWTELRDNIDKIKVEDPANPTGNDLSECFDQAVKSSLSSLARIALQYVEQDNWKGIFGEVKPASTAEKLAAVDIIIKQGGTSPKPWLR